MDQLRAAKDLTDLPDREAEREHPMSFSPYIQMPSQLSGTLQYTLPSEPDFPSDIIAQARTLLANAIGVPIENLQEHQAVAAWQFQSYPCPNTPVAKDTLVVVLRAATAQTEKTGRGLGVVLLRKDAERHTTPTTTRYTCHLPTLEHMTWLFYASEWIANLVKGSGDFYRTLRYYVERTVNRLDDWSVLEHDETLAETTPMEPRDMEEDPEVTVVVELASEGVYEPGELLRGLAPYKYHEVSFGSRNFQIHRLGFIEYTDQREMLLLRAQAEHQILAYDSLDLGRKR